MVSHFCTPAQGIACSRPNPNRALWKVARRKTKSLTKNIQWQYTFHAKFCENFASWWYTLVSLGHGGIEEHHCEGDQIHQSKQPYKYLPKGISSIKWDVRDKSYTYIKTFHKLIVLEQVVCMFLIWKIVLFYHIPKVSDYAKLCLESPGPLSSKC